MNILIVGGGGREHALAWKATQSTHTNQIYVAPGNAGTALEPNVTNVAIAANDINALLTFAKQQSIDLTLVGPEIPLALGIVDQFTAAGLACFGPNQQAAQLESSKVFSKTFMQRHSIPTAEYTEHTDLSSALATAKQHPYPLVIKADGLAAGKGVIIAHNYPQAEQAIHDMLADNQFGTAGQRIIIEEFLVGEEASFMVVCDGVNVIPLATSQDHKARDAGDKGPNTGGMGAYSPAAVITPTLQEHIMQTIILPTIHGMRADGITYTGFLYAGLMITATGNIKVLEFNCRLGDPETQPILMRLQSDLIALCLATIQQRLPTIKLHWDSRPAVGVVLAAQGYPGAYPKGQVIHGLEAHEPPYCKTFHAGTTMANDHTVTNGGRVLCVTATGQNITQAQANAYQHIQTIRWEGMYYRPDIGYRAVTREQATV